MIPPHHVLLWPIPLCSFRVCPRWQHGPFNDNTAIHTTMAHLKLYKIVFFLITQHFNSLNFCNSLYCEFFCWGVLGKWTLEKAIFSVNMSELYFFQMELEFMSFYCLFYAFSLSFFLWTKFPEKEQIIASHSRWLN